MKVKFYVLLFFISTLAYSQIRVHFLNNKAGVVPGHTHSLVIKLFNDFDKTVKLDLSKVKMPDHWLLLSHTNFVSIASKQTDIQIITIKILEGSPHGTYKIYYKLLDFETKHLLVTKEIELVVEKKFKLSLKNLSTPSFVMAGDTIQTTFLLKNEGNVAQSIELFSEHTEWVKPDTVALQPGEVKNIQVKKVTSSDLKKLDHHIIKLYAKPLKGKQIFSYGVTKVVPIIESKEDIYHRFFVDASVIYAGRFLDENFKSGFQGDLSGSGSIDPKGAHRLSFRVVGPSQFDLITFGQFNRYFINYNNKRLYLHIGDKAFRSSFLSELNRYGRGTEFSLKLKKLKLGAYYNSARFFYSDQGHSYNAYLAYYFNNNINMRYGILQKEVHNIRIHYLVNQFKLNPHIFFETEASLSNREDETETGYAYRIKSRTNYRKFNINTSFISADENYSGFYSNTMLLNGNIRYMPFPKMTLGISYNRDTRNVKLDTIFGVAPVRNSYYGQINYRFTKSTTLRLNVGEQERFDRLDTSRFDFKENFIRVTFLKNIGKLSFNLEGQFAKTENRLFNTTQNTAIYRAGVGIKRWNTDFSFFSDYLNTNRFDKQKDQQIIFGTKIRSNVSKKSVLNVSYQNTYTIDEQSRDRNLFELQYSQKFFKTHEIGLISRYALARNETKNGDFSIQLRYTIRLGIPIKKVKNYGTLIGTIKNLGVKKIEGIRLHLGKHTAITDAQGNFKFNNLNPKIHHLVLDQSTIGLDEIPTVDFPIETKIKEGENQLHFGLTKGCTIKGRVELMSQNIRPKEQNLKYENVIIEASNGISVFRKIVDVNEAFEFKNLLPDTWDIKVYRNTLKSSYQIKNLKFKISAEAGEKKTITVNILKKPKLIKFQSGSFKISKKRTH